MATITSLGTGSGLDLESLVTKLMTAESTPLTALKKKQTTVETKISALGKLTSALAALQTAAGKIKPNLTQAASEKFATYSATVANTTIASATATTGAVAGSYSLEVTRLAASQQIKSAGYASSSTVVSATGGTLSLSLGTLSGSTYSSNNTISIDIPANATLADVRNAINNKGSGVTATIVNGTSGSQLVLTGPEGQSNTMQLSGISGLAYDPSGATTSDFSQTIAPQDATFKINGIDATSSSNKVTGKIDGITLNLTATNAGSPTVLTVGKEIDTQITQALQDFITAYNSANSTMKTLGAYNATTKVAGDLQGNSTLRTAVSSLRNLVFGTTSGSATSAYQTLSNIGVSVGTDGALSLNTTKLKAAVAADPGVVADLVGNVGKAFNTTIDGLIGTDGSVKTATEGLNKTVTSLTKQQERLQDRLTSIEARYRVQFTAMDTLVSKLNSSATYLTNYISSLNNSNTK